MHYIFTWYENGYSFSDFCNGICTLWLIIGTLCPSGQEYKREHPQDCLWMAPAHIRLTLTEKHNSALSHLHKHFLNRQTLPTLWLHNESCIFKEQWSPTKSDHVSGLLTFLYRVHVNIVIDSWTWWWVVFLGLMWFFQNRSQQLQVPERPDSFTQHSFYNLYSLIRIQWGFLQKQFYITNCRLWKW